MRTIDERSVVAWVDAWSSEVASVDLTSVRRRFSDDVVAFGTFAEVVVGLESLYRDQWSKVWPHIEDFVFLTDNTEVLVSSDRLMAVAAVGWSSTGFAENGERFSRPGRATVVLTRSTVDAEWLGVHTHLSLARGVPQLSFGAPPAR